MSIDYTIELKEGYALVTATGELGGTDDLLDYAKTMVGEVVRLDQRHILLDHRAITGHLDTMTGYSFATTVTEEVEHIRTRRWAVVTSPERMEFLKFFETVAQNRGMMMLAFESVDEALTWLVP